MSTMSKSNETNYYGTDNAGRPYAKISDIKVGVEIKFDLGFACLTPNTKYVVHQNDRGYFVACSDGEHYLESQCHDAKGKATDHYVGVYLVSSAVENNLMCNESSEVVMSSKSHPELLASEEKKTYIFQWGVGNFRFIGPFDNQDKAADFVIAHSSIKESSLWTLMLLTAGELQYEPTICLKSPITDSIVEILHLDNPDVRKQYQQNTQSYKTYEFYVMTWDEAVILTGPFSDITKAQEWGASWQDANGDNPQWQITLFSLSTLLQDVAIVDPNGPIHTLEAMRIAR